MSNRTYNIIKYTALCAIPAIGAIVYGIAAVWGFACSEQILGTTLLIDTFVGALVSKLAYDYKKAEE